MPLSKFLSCRGEHILDEDPIAGVRRVDQDMGHRPHQLSILDDGTAAHA